MLVYIVLFLAGLFIGGFLESTSWKKNSLEYRRILRGTTLYKVVQLNSRESWDYLKIYERSR